MPVDLDLDLGVEADGDGVRAVRVGHPPPAGRGAVDVVQPLVELSHRRRGEVDRLPRELGGAHVTVASSHEYTRPGSGSQTSASSAPGSTAIALYSDAIATQSSVSASTAGLQAIGSRRTANPSAVPTAKV